MPAQAVSSIAGHPHAVSYITGKGGAGKTSVAVHTAGYAASKGYKTLLVDIDPRGAMADDLGYADEEWNDQGESFFNSLRSGRPLEPVSGVRPNLDVVVGGYNLEDVLALAAAGKRPRFVNALHDCLTPIAADYHLIVVDCPPGDRLLQMMALTATRHLVVTTKFDKGSMRAAEEAGEVAAEVMESTGTVRNLLCCVMFDFDTGAARMRESSKALLRERLGGVAPILDSYVRHVPAVAEAIRSHGRLAYELEENPIPGVKVDAAGLADDYRAIAHQTIRLLGEKNQQAAAALAGTAQPA
ncbi:ParA family protein [Bailinhaonella thermotolerans]|uniref:ParA family protein n=1 Tax=Bailinhaonella thermotolerans TaxID=1070861 RepID=A0A3A4AJX3_9ACTN|nr:ParA family protein [Bailinhaonella thermotolerans]RJL21235.1 ParA family protein [Bailinhaonella thermotolerans]